MSEQETSFWKTVAAYAITAAAVIAVLTGIAIGLYCAFPTHPYAQRVRDIVIDWRLERLRDDFVRANPGFDRDDLRCEFSGFSIVSCDVFADAGTVDLSPLRGLPLTSVSFMGETTRYPDFSPLAGMPLKFFEISTRTPTGDLSVLKGAPLQELLIMSPMLSRDLSQLKGLPLEVLYLDSPEEDYDLSPLRGMQLREIGIACRHIDNLAALKGMPLAKVGIYHADITDLAPLAGMPIRYLELWRT